MSITQEINEFLNGRPSPVLLENIPSSSNGRTLLSERKNRGSNPCDGASCRSRRIKLKHKNLQLSLQERSPLVQRWYPLLAQLRTGKGKHSHRSIEWIKRILRLLERDGELCWLCKMPLNPQTVSLDHFVPQSRGGSGSLSNLQLACSPCNGARGSPAITRKLFPNIETPKNSPGDPLWTLADAW